MIYKQNLSKSRWEKELKNPINTKLAEEMQTTINGKIIDIQYLLSVKLICNSWCSSSYPKLQIPIFIHALEQNSSQIVEAPEGWNPIIYEEAKLVVPVDESDQQPNQIDFRVDESSQSDNLEELGINETKILDKNQSEYEENEYISIPSEGTNHNKEDEDFKSNDDESPLLGNEIREA